jgi:hypothetical protein
MERSVTREAREPDYAERWYSAATVRHAERIMVPRPTDDEFIFPKSRQIVVEHPIVLGKGNAVVGWILAQSAYKYMYEIGLLETKYVIDCGLNIVNGKLPHANDLEKREALAVVIDEGYHAYVALDFIMQMKQNTGIAPLRVPTTNRNLDAVRRALDVLPAETHGDFQLLSVCLAEHTLTKDLLSIGKEKDTTRSFTQAMTDHVADEGRHANYFARMLKRHWPLYPESSRESIAALLPGYLDDYLAGDADREFDRAVLQAAGLSIEEAAAVLTDTHARYLANMNGYIDVTKTNLVRLLERTEVMQHPAVRKAFDEAEAARTNR